MPTRSTRKRTRKASRRKQAVAIAVQRATQARGVPAAARLARWARAAARGTGDITLRVVGAAEGRRLNRAYRGKDYATNVLTFAYDDTLPLYGDVVICAPVVEREAREQDKGLLAHYAHLTIHAALHLQGYDHENKRDATKMEARETALMLKLRYPAPYLISK